MYLLETIQYVCCRSGDTAAAVRDSSESICWTQHVLNLRPSDHKSPYCLAAFIQYTCNPEDGLETHIAIRATMILKIHVFSNMG